MFVSFLEAKDESNYLMKDVEHVDVKDALKKIKFIFKITAILFKIKVIEILIEILIIQEIIEEEGTLEIVKKVKKANIV